MLLMECESGFRQDETTHKFVGLTLPYHFRGIMLYWGSIQLLCSLLPYVLVCGSLQRCWWCISLTYRRCMLEVFCKAFLVVTPWFYDDGIRFSPLAVECVQLCFCSLFANGTIYCFKVTEELLLMLTANVLDRVAYLMDNTELALVSGNTLCMASGKPFRPSMQHISISRTPLFWRSLRTSKPKLAPSLLEKSHSDIYIPKDTILSIARIVILSKKQFIFSVFIIFA